MKSILTRNKILHLYSLIPLGLSGNSNAYTVRKSEDDVVCLFYAQFLQLVEEVSHKCTCRKRHETMQDLATTTLNAQSGALSIKLGSGIHSCFGNSCTAPQRSASLCSLYTGTPGASV